MLGRNRKGTFDVLVIDDDALVRETLVAFLEDQGLRVHATDRVADGLRVLRGPGARMVLLDLVLGETLGPEDVHLSTRSLVEAAARSGADVLLVSGLPDLAHRAAALGARAWLEKPFTSGELLDRLAGLLGPASHAPHAPPRPSRRRA